MIFNTTSFPIILFYLLNQNFYSSFTFHLYLYGVSILYLYIFKFSNQFLRHINKYIENERFNDKDFMLDGMYADECCFYLEKLISNITFVFN